MSVWLYFRRYLVHIATAGPVEVVHDTCPSAIQEDKLVTIQ